MGDTVGDTDTLHYYTSKGIIVQHQKPILWGF